MRILTQKLRSKLSMNSQHKKCLGWGFLASVIVPFVAPAPAKAVHIARSLDIPGVRGAIAPNEGYLSYHLFSPFAEERTGWTDIRHPALDGKRDIMRGYDWSDNQVSVLTHNVRVDPPAGVAGNSIVTKKLRRRCRQCDLRSGRYHNFARKQCHYQWQRHCEQCGWQLRAKLIAVVWLKPQSQREHSKPILCG